MDSLNFKKILKKRANHYMLGGDDFLKGVATCPHPENSPEEKEWRNGFLDAQFLKERF